MSFLHNRIKIFPIGIRIMRIDPPFSIAFIIIAGERPVNIIGALRGTAKTEKDGSYDVASFAVEISADTFYSRTFTIDHQ